VPPQTPRGQYRQTFEQALDQLKEFKPDLIGVSAGFDAYARDPLLQMTLEREDFAQFGQWLSNIDVPVAVALEGGYSSDLPELIDAFLTGWQS
jgi:acetoin utilization deacetylase AcuC-like enzyme